MSTTNTTIEGIRAGDNPVSVNFNTSYLNDQNARVEYTVKVNNIIKKGQSNLNSDATSATVNLNGLTGTLNLHKNSAISFTGNLLWATKTEVVLDGGIIVAINS